MYLAALTHQGLARSCRYRSGPKLPHCYEIPPLARARGALRVRDAPLMGKGALPCVCAPRRVPCVLTTCLQGLAPLQAFAVDSLHQLLQREWLSSRRGARHASIADDHRGSHGGKVVRGLRIGRTGATAACDAASNGVLGRLMDDTAARSCVACWRETGHAPVLAGIPIKLHSSVSVVRDRCWSVAGDARGTAYRRGLRGDGRSGPRAHTCSRRSRCYGLHAC